MGCVSSTLLNHDDPDFPQIGASTAFAHHIVKLTSTTYGLLTLDPPPPPPASDHPSPIIPPTPPPRFTLKPDDIINSWELMAGLDSSTPPPPLPPPAAASHSCFPFSPPPSISNPATTKQNSNPNLPDAVANLAPTRNSLDDFEKLCPPNGENKVVIYTTTLRGIRKTFEACNAVRSAFQGLGVLICERDISMDKGFREELRELMVIRFKGKAHHSNVPFPTELIIPPRVFIKGRYIGGVEEVLRIAEDGALGNLLSGLPKLRAGINHHVCDGCGDARFLPCFHCNGSCKMVTVVEGEMERTLVLRCSHCNENGLVLCPICT